MAIDTTLTEADEADLLEIFGVSVDDLQSDISVEDGLISGTLHYAENVNTFDMSLGHHFLVLHITSDDADEITVCMDPTQGSGPVALDESGVVILQVKDDQSQTVRISASNDSGGATSYLSIDGLTLETEV